MRLDSYWLDTAPRFAGAEAGPVEGRVDVAVIGGGFTGLSAALALARRGASVAVLEAGKVASAASGRNGGHVNNGTAVDFGALAQRLGLPAARAVYHAYDAAVDTVERIVREQQISCGFRRCGKIKLAAKPAHYEKLARSFELLQREVDPDTMLVPAARIRDEVGSDRFHGGLVQAKSAQLHMGRFATGLAEAARRHGARLFENAPVVRLIRTRGGGREIVTSRGAVTARQVLLATGASMAGPFGYFRRRIIPIGSFILATAPLTPAQLDSIMPTRRNATTTRHIGNYFRISPDNRLIWGGRARFALSNPSSDLKSGHILETSLRETFPQLGRVDIDYCWGGVIDLTIDRLPRAGEHDGLFYAMGFSGHGAQMSVHMGQEMAKVLAGERALCPFRTLPWPAIPGHFGPPWFMPVVGAWYRLQDWLH
ncbi:MAG TPA: FAD-binding oxidoreductase [Alphaproteobacteria bacterium]|nr:FAD-binding oxidoreductase [Alphaproteobacteria bacterium]